MPLGPSRWDRRSDLAHVRRAMLPLAVRSPRRPPAASSTPPSSSTSPLRLHGTLLTTHSFLCFLLLLTICIARTLLYTTRTPRLTRASYIPPPCFRHSRGSPHYLQSTSLYPLASRSALYHLLSDIPLDISSSRGSSMSSRWTRRLGQGMCRSATWSSTMRSVLIIPFPHHLLYWGYRPSMHSLPAYRYDCTMAL